MAKRANKTGSRGAKKGSKKSRPAARAKPAKKSAKNAAKNAAKKPARAPNKSAKAATKQAAPKQTAVKAPSVATTPSNGITPFAIVETEPGKFSLLLNQFEPAGEAFAAAGIDGGGYAWEGVAKHVVETAAPELGGRFGLDPEASMFCAYGQDRAALEQLGAHLARLFNDRVALSAVIQAIGPDGFDD